MEEKLIDQPFVCKSYSKSELAQLYLPKNARVTAVRKFNAWLLQSPTLWAELQKQGINLRTRYYTAVQVRTIVEHLGNP